MSARVTGWAWQQQVLLQRKAILLWLANRATDAGVCFPSKRELAEQTGLSERMVRYHLAWLASDQDDDGQPKTPLLQIITRPVDSERNTSNVYVLRVPWAEPAEVRAELAELKYVPSAALAGVGGTGATQGGNEGGGCNPLHPVGATGCTQVGATHCTENRSRRNYHRKRTPLPPTGAQQQGSVTGNPDPGAGLSDEQANTEARAHGLVEAFQRGLGAEGLASTPTMQRRDLAIARQLAAAGTTPDQAEAFAQEMTATPGRLAPVDLRAFERERLSWLARRRVGVAGTRHLVDRTGKPPSWLEPAEAPAPTEAPPRRTTPAPTRPAVTQGGLFAGDVLATSLTAALGLAVGAAGGRP